MYYLVREEKVEKKEKKSTFPAMKKNKEAQPTQVKRFHALASEGLSAAQVAERKAQGLFEEDCHDTERAIKAAIEAAKLLICKE